MFQGQNVTELDVGGLLNLLTARWNGTNIQFPEAPKGVLLKSRAIHDVSAREQCCNGSGCFSDCHSGGKVASREHCCNGCHSDDWCAIPHVK